VLEGGLRDFHAREHAGHFPFPAGLVQDFGLAEGLPAFHALAQADVARGQAGDLGQMGDAKQLVLAREREELPSHNFGNAAGDARIHFVEDHAGARALAEGGLQRQGDPGKLPA
jgi:hypothetical protein